MAERRTKQQGSSRERVLAGATEEFASHGFAGARIDRIAQRVGLNVRMIYYHFANKEGLYRGVLRAINVEAAAMLARVAEEVDPAKRSTEALSRYFDLLTSHPHFADILVREYLDGGGHLRRLFEDEPELYDHIYTGVHRMVQGAIDAGELREAPVPETVMIVSSAASFLWASRRVHDLFLEGRRPSAAEWKALILDLVLTGLKRR
jgi:AcrR family transcriptional regulator